MAISFVAAGAVATGANPTVAMPAGIQADDLLILTTCGSASSSTPSGWGLVGTKQGTGQFICVYYKRATASESSVAVTQSGTSTKAVIVAYRGAATVDISSAYTTGSSTSATTASLTTTFANDYVLSIYADATGTTKTWTAPASTTARVNSDATSGLRGLLIVDELQAAAGASTTRTATISASNTWAAVAVAIRPITTFYWIGGSGTWDNSTATNWSLSSGGSTAPSAPSVVDTAAIDTSSGTGTITVSGGVCNDLTVSATQALTLASGGTLSVYGSLTTPAASSFVWSCSTSFLAPTTGKTITTNGFSFSGNFTFNSANGGWTLQDNFTSANGITLTTGSLDLNSKTVTCSSFTSNSGSTRTLTFGTATLNAGTVTFGSLGLTLSAASSTINITSASSSFSGAPGLTFGTLAFTNTGLTSANIAGGGTFTNITLPILATKRVTRCIMNPGNSFTITGTFSVQSGGTDPTKRIAIITATPGVQATISSASNDLFAVDFQDIIATGTASWSDSSRTNYWGDAKGNTGITFATGRDVYWNLTGTVNWTDAGWALTSTGTPDSSYFPLAQDNPTFTDAGAASDVTLDGSYFFNNLDMSGRTSSMTLNFGVSITGRTLGNVTIGTGVTIGGSASTLSFEGVSTQTLTTNGVAFNNVGITLNNINATLLLADDVSLVNRSFTVTAGTLDTQNNDISCTQFSANSSRSKTVTLGTSTITCSENASPVTFGSTALTLSAASSTFVLSDATNNGTKTFTLSTSLTFGTIVIGGGSATGQTVTFTGSSATIGALLSTKTVAFTINFPNVTTTTIGTWGVSGSSGNAVTVKSSSTGSTTTIVNVTNQTSGIDYLDIQDVGSSNTEPVTFYAGANTLLRSNVKGVVASAPVANKFIYIYTSGTTKTIPANWDSFANTHNEFHLIGAGGGGGAAYYVNPNGASGGGGGGGGYTKATNLSFTAGDTILTSVGAAGSGGGGSSGSAGGTTSLTLSGTSVSFVNEAHNNASSATSLTINKPTSTAQNDLMIAFIVSSNTSTFTTPSGWTVGASLGNGRVIYYKVAGASEPSSYAFAISTGASALFGYIVTYSNATWDGAGALSGSATNPSVAPSMTVGIGGGLLFDWVSSNATATATAPTGFSTRIASNSASGTTNALYYQDAVAGATGTVSATMTSGTARSALFAIYPSDAVVYTAGGGDAGLRSPTTPTGGAGGTGSTYNGGSGGNGSTTGNAAVNCGSGGGGGAGGPNGNGGAGGNGYASSSSPAGGGGGGNGGGTAGSDGSSGGGGNGGNNYLGVGGGTTLAAAYNGGGPVGQTSSNGLAGSSGTDIYGTGSGGGASGSGASASTPGTGGVFGGGGAGGGKVSSSTASGSSGGQGAIIMVYSIAGTTSPSNFFLLF